MNSSNSIRMKSFSAWDSRDTAAFFSPLTSYVTSRDSHSLPPRSS